MNQVVLLIGGNIGDRMEYIQNCHQLTELHIGSISLKSNIYETAAWGGIDQQDFLNQGIVVSTTLSPNETLVKCLEIEHLLDRKRVVRWGERTMDIDIIFYNYIIMKTLLLEIPHPRYQLRNFVLTPLNEIIPNYKCPQLNKSINQLLESCTDDLHVIKPE